MDRSASQARGSDFAVRRWTQIDTDSLRPLKLVHLCLACLRGSHCLCVSVRLCLPCTSSIWLREISAHTAHRSDGRCSVFWKLYYRQSERSAVRSWRAASSRRSSCSLRSPCWWSSNNIRLTSCPQLTIHDQTLDDTSSSSGRQTEKRMVGSLVRRFAERSSNPKFGIAILENSHPAASRNDLEFSICRRSIFF